MLGIESWTKQKAVKNSEEEIRAAMKGCLRYKGRNGKLIAKNISLDSTSRKQIKSPSVHIARAQTCTHRCINMQKNFCEEK